MAGCVAAWSRVQENECISTAEQIATAAVVLLQRLMLVSTSTAVLT
jgi:hypothetical protein